MSGSTYCGSFDWLSVKKRSGTITQQTRSTGSRAAGSGRAAHVTRPCRRRARAGMIQGNAATGTIGREDQNGAVRGKLVVGTRASAAGRKTEAGKAGRRIASAPN